MGFCLEPHIHLGNKGGWGGGYKTKHSSLGMLRKYTWKLGETKEARTCGVG